MIEAVLLKQKISEMTDTFKKLDGVREVYIRDLQSKIA
jgi:hypothetical protein